MRDPEMSPSSFLCQTSAPTMANLFHRHPLFRTGLRVPQKIHRESSPSYGAIPYYTWVLLSKLSSIRCSNGCLEMPSKEVASLLLAGVGRGAGRKHINKTIARMRGLKWGGLEIRRGYNYQRRKTRAGRWWQGCSVWEWNRRRQLLVAAEDWNQWGRAPSPSFTHQMQKYSFALAVAAVGHAVPPPEEGRWGCEQHGSVCPSDKGALTWQDSALRLEALPSPLWPNSYKFRTSLLGRVALSGGARF